MTPLDIAKENGAYPFDPNGMIGMKDKFVMTEAQLTATINQVCAPLLIALEAADIWIDTLPVPTSSATRMGILVTEALAAHKTTMGVE